MDDTAAEKTPITPAPTGEAAPAAPVEVQAEQAAPAPTYPDGAPIPADAVAAVAALPVGVPVEAEPVPAALVPPADVPRTLTPPMPSADAAPAAPVEVKAEPPRPTVGRVVWYAYAAKDGYGRETIETRPAIVVRVWERTDGRMPLVQLAVLIDGSNDHRPDVLANKMPALPDAIDPQLGAYLKELQNRVERLAWLADLVQWKTSVSYDEAGGINSWRWMPFQLGQAKKTDDVGLKALESVAELSEHVLALFTKLQDLGRRCGHIVE